MKQLTLLRHAKSSRKDTSLADFDRPLSKRGREDAPRMGRWLRQREVAPDLLIASPALRTRVTAEVVLEALGLGDDRLLFREEVYEADLERLLEVVHVLDDTCDHVLLVGHNPGLTELWNYLSEGKAKKIPTCGAFSLTMMAASWREVGAGSGTPAFTATPKEIDGTSAELHEKADKGKKKKRCLHGKSEAKAKPGNYRCDKCGAVSDLEDRLCRPGKIRKQK